MQKGVQGMNNDTQLKGLDQFLTEIYGEPTSLGDLIDSLGFERAQADRLRASRLPALAEQFIEVLRRRLTWEEKDLYFRVLVRRFGLDGEPAADIEAAARDLGVEPSYAAFAEGE